MILRRHKRRLKKRLPMKKSKLIGLALGMLWSVSGAAQIVQGSLPDLTDGTAGVDTVLTADIWGENPDADDVIRQIQDCADINFNPAELTILRQVLLTDVGGKQSLEDQNESYLKARLETLLKQGMFDEVILLVDRVQPKHRSDVMKQLRAEALFALGRVQEVCTDEVLSAFGEQETFMRVICADALQVPPEPALAFELYREREENEHPFLNAAGDVLYHNLEPEMPSGEPSVWELPILAKAFGNDIFKLKFDREKLWTLIAHEHVPHEVRIQADHLVNTKTEIEKPDGHVLDELIQMAKARQELERRLPGTLHQKQAGIERAE